MTQARLPQQRPTKTSRLHRDIPGELAACKGFIRTKLLMLDDLSKCDDGAPPSPGISSVYGFGDDWAC